MYVLLALLALFVAVRAIVMIKNRFNTTDIILKALLQTYAERNERIIELRCLKDKVKQSTREFEIKTASQRHYIVSMQGRSVTAAAEMRAFSIAKEDSYITGVIDPWKRINIH